MSRQTMYRIHRWIATTVGAFLLLWLTTGIAMVMFPETLPGRPPAPVDYREVTVSPAGAVQALAKTLGTPVEASSVGLRRLAGTAVYEVALSPGGTHLIDGRSGRLFTITREVAEQIAREDFGASAPVLRVARLTRHDFGYPWGALPAYRVEFDDGRATMSVVSASDGTVRRSDRWTRIRLAMGRFHVLGPVKFLTGREDVQRVLLILASVLGIGAAGTGYYLALPRRRP